MKVSFEGFPFKECLEKHAIDFCLEQDCKNLGTHDNGQTFYCSIVLTKLEQAHPPKPSPPEPKKPFCKYCNNTEDFTVKGKATVCVSCGRFASKIDANELRSLQEAIRTGSLKPYYPFESNL